MNSNIDAVFLVLVIELKTNALYWASLNKNRKYLCIACYAQRFGPRGIGHAGGAFLGLMSDALDNEWQRYRSCGRCSFWIFVLYEFLLVYQCIFPTTICFDFCMCTKYTRFFCQRINYKILFNNHCDVHPNFEIGIPTFTQFINIHFSIFIV